ncbi:MAG TPA: hypothetical protein VGL34_09655 [Steroidobacteraceae bacterium]|jgi:hypothetical protein
MFKLETPNGSPVCLALAYHMVGRAKESNAALDQAIGARPNQSAFGIARVYAYRGQSETAFEWLERAYRDRDPAMPYLKGDPSFEKLREDSRYKALLHKMNLPE